MVADLTEDERKELLAYLPEECAGSSRLEAWIAGASFRVSRCYFGKAYVYALSLMVAHRWAMSEGRPEGTPGAATSMREGDLSVGYSVANGSEDGDLTSTSFGQEFLSLMRQYSPRPGITGAAFRGGCGGDALQSFV